MTAYVQIPDAVLAIGKPFTYAIARALRDNMVAIAEQDATAPPIASLAKLVPGGTSHVYDNTLGTTPRVFRVFMISAGSGGSWGGDDYFGDDPGFPGNPGACVTAIVTCPVGSIATFSAPAGGPSQVSNSVAPPPGGSATVSLSAGGRGITVPGGGVSSQYPQEAVPPPQIIGPNVLVLTWSPVSSNQPGIVGCSGQGSYGGKAGQTAGGPGVIILEMLQ